MKFIKQYWGKIANFFDLGGYEKDIEKYLKEYNEPLCTTINPKDEELDKKIEFMYKNSEAAFESTLPALEKQEKRIILILTYIFAFISYAIFKIIDLFHHSKNDNFFKIYLLITIICYLILAIFLLMYGWRARRIARNGNDPKNYLAPGILNASLIGLKISEMKLYLGTYKS